MSQTMTMRAYKAAVRKTCEAHAALSAACGAAYEFSRLSAAIAPMQAAVDSLRVQVCGRCNERGYYDSRDGFTSYSCSHPGVPRFNVRTGEEM